MKKRLIQTISIITAVCLLSGCGLHFGADNRTEGEKKYPEFLTIDVFDIQSNTQGLQRGWFAKIVRDKFNMQLNIIAPNQEDNSDAVYESMRASGKLGDLIFANVDAGKLRELVREGLVLDMTDYIEDCDNLKKYQKQIEVTSSYAETEGLFAIPSEITEKSEVEPADYDEPTNAPSLRWDLYKEIGYPEINTLEDLLPVLKDMQDIAGTSDSGKPVYALSLFSDWDGGAMQNAGAIASLYGYDSLEFVLMNPETGEIIDLMDADSPYFRALNFFFEANQLGLVDPESTNQNYETLAAKYRDGAVLYSFWPWMGKSLYNSDERISQGKGFASARLNDASYLTWGNDPNGKQNFSLMIGATSKDPQRLVDFANWLYSDEGIECSGSPTGDFRGPEGLTWTNENGTPKLTEFGIRAFVNMETNLEVPEEYGGGLWSQGVSSLNFKPLDRQEIDEKGIPYRYQMWEDYIERTRSKLYSDWQNHYETDLEPIEYFQNRDMLTIIPGVEWTGSEYPEYIETIKQQCRDTIIDYSWKMVFADTRTEYDSLKKEMTDTLDRLGYEEVVKLNFEQAKSKAALFESVSGGKS